MAAEPPESTTLPTAEAAPADGSPAEQAETSPTSDAPVSEAAPADATPSGRAAITGKLSARELIAAFEAEQLKSDLPEIFVGDTVRVGVRIREGNKERIQPYEGVVIAMRHGGLNETITVRRIFQGIGVERVFMLHSPQVASVKVERRGKVRRAKLFYLRDRVGKATRVKQRFDR
ncbi:MAG: 50S ribosomal protein L19 [Cyanobacteriota bacterium]|nr:50S ribosomal protein L19 [Cyanobacteriota bacterium]